jgi:hypothetical protein
MRTICGSRRNAPMKRRLGGFAFASDSQPRLHGGNRSMAAVGCDHFSQVGFDVLPAARRQTSRKARRS